MSISTQSRTIAQALATALQARENCRKRIAEHDASNDKWLDKWSETIDSLMALAPSGSGIDNGTRLEESAFDKGDVLRFTCDYHHMNEGGYYDGWTSHRVIVRPSFTGLDIQVTGRDRNEVKDYLAETFLHWLSSEAPADKPTIGDELAALHRAQRGQSY